jgi:peptidoglycan/xylan/chitin deacetylase (PgdA/CDA1 family)
MSAALVGLGWSALAAGGLALGRMWRQESRGDRLLVLLYHRVVSPETYAGLHGAERIFSIAEDRFEQQLAWLREDGYEVVGLDRVVQALERAEPLPERAVCITFDDGCESVYRSALPRLARHGMTATVFVTTDPEAWIFHEGEYTERRMTLEELRALAKADWCIGSHAVTHRGLNEMSEAEALGELEGSRKLLAEWLGRPVEHFAVPLNFYSRATLAQCRRAGYRSVCTSDPGALRRSSSPFHIRRVTGEGSHDLESFRRSLEPRSLVQRRVLAALKKLPPKLLGERIWMPLRERIFASALGPWLSFRHLRVALAAAAALFVAVLIVSTLALVL